MYTYSVSASDTDGEIVQDLEAVEARFPSEAALKAAKLAWGRPLTLRYVSGLEQRRGANYTATRKSFLDHNGFGVGDPLGRVVVRLLTAVDC